MTLLGGSWIVDAQSCGEIDRSLPPELVLYTIYARGCAPVPGFLKASGQYSDGQIVEWMVAACFSGLQSRSH